MEKYKWLCSIVTGAVVTFAKQYALIIAFVMIAIVFDWITGMTKAKVLGEPISKKKGIQGFWKKFALCVALFFGFFLDYFIPYVLAYINLNIPVTALFGMIFGCYIVINECISICENLYLCDSSILPKWTIKVLRLAKDQIDEKGDGDNEDSIN